MGVFYEALYKSTDIDVNEIEDYFSQINVENILNKNDKQMLELFPTLEECTDALFAMKNNKSPGLDGLPCEFYKTFWSKLKKNISFLPYKNLLILINYQSLKDCRFYPFYTKKEIKTCWKITDQLV
jgi:hypothetical protein